MDRLAPKKSESEIEDEHLEGGDEETLEDINSTKI